MASLAESVMSTAEQGVQQQSHTVGDAMQAYHIAATAEHARQSLEMEKQNTAMNKAKWMHSQYDALSRMADGKVKDMMIDAMKEQVPQIFPDANVDNLDVLRHRPDLIPAARDSMSKFVNGKDLTPDDIENINAHLAASPLDQNAAWEKVRQEKMQMEGNRLKAESMQSRVGAMQDNATLGAVKAIHEEAKPFIQQINAFETDLDQLKNKPTWQTFNEAMINYGNAIQGLKGSGISDAKLHEMQAPLSGKQVGGWASYLSNHPDAKENIADPQAVRWLQGKIQEVSNIKEQQMGVATKRRAFIGSARINNPNLVGAMQDTATMYNNKQWRAISPDYTGPRSGQTASNMTPPASAIHYDDGSVLWNGQVYVQSEGHWVPKAPKTAGE